MFVIIQLVGYGLASFLAVKLALFIRYYIDLCQKLRKLPHRPTHWLYGNARELKDSTDYVASIKDMVQTDGIRVYCVWIGPIPIVGVTHPATCKELMHKVSRKADGFGGLYRLFKSWTGSGLPFISGEKWKRNRKRLNPAFHIDILKGYVTVMNDVSTTFLDRLWVEAKSGKSVDIFPYAGRATLDAMLRCSLSYEGNVQEDIDNEYLHAVQGLTEIIWQRMLNPFLLVDFIFKMTTSGRKHDKLIKIVHNFTGTLIQARREKLKMHPDLTTRRRRLDFLDILLTAHDENGQHLTPYEVQSEVDAFKIWREDIQNFEYLTQFLREVLRFCTPVPLIARTHSETIIIDGFEIPPGPRIDILLTAIHSNGEVWPNHTKFDPDRFSRDNRDTTENYGYIPFSAFERNCIGQQFALNQLKIAIAKLVNRYKVTLDDTYEDPKLIPDIITRPSNGIHVKLKQR